MAKHIGNIAFGAFMLTASIYLWLVADAFPVFEKYRDVDSDFWPKILMTMIGIFSVVVIYQSVTALKVDLAGQAAGVRSREHTPSIRVDWKRFATMGILCVGYFYGLQTLGFILSTLIFLWISIAFIGVDGRFLRVFYPVVFTAALSFLFVKIFELSLHRGQWVFREFSLLFY